jgi:2-polyprenyl-6-methoxyphenol hydroxylase-like FAD-dependent oxidoreductase
MKALIAGAGIGGLATGIALTQVGLEVDMFERSPQLREVGAGLMIWPNGTRSLQSLGVEVPSQKVRAIVLRAQRGGVLMESPVDDISRRYGSDVKFVHRADLQAALARRLGSEALHLGAEVVAFEDSGDQVQVRLGDGRTQSGDLLVGADGLRSAVRAQLLGDSDPIYLGSTIWRGVVSSDGIPLERGVGVNWVGRGAEFLAFYVGDASIYWAGVTKEAKGERAGPGGHKKDLLDRFRQWPEAVPALITATEDGAILRNDMYDRRPVPHWSAGRVTLVGDAAHPMTPNQGQGACQALEDAVALGESLKGASNLAAAFTTYEGLRMKRAYSAVTLSRQATRGVQLENRLACAIRDRLPGLIPRSVMLRLLDRTLS